MNAESTTKIAIGFFVTILVGALLSAVIGGLFGSLVATVSPDFVAELFRPQATHEIVRYAFAIGMIWGLFIGAAVSGFACFLAAVIKILKVQLDYRKERLSNKTPGSEQ